MSSNPPSQMRGNPTAMRGTSTAGDAQRAGAASGPALGRRRLFTASAALGTAALASKFAHAQAQTPALRMTLGYPAGGAVDVAARAYGEALRAAMGTTLTVENKPGAGGTLAVEQWIQQPADGAHLLFTPPDPIAIAPNTGRPLRYSAADAIPVAQVCVFGFAIGVGPAAPVKTLPEFLEWARANPDKASYGTPGIGSTMHFLGEELERQGKVRLNHVPYKGGAQSIVDVMGGQLAALISTAPILVANHRAGKIRVLAVTTPKRSPALPDVPTFSELGLPGMTEDAFFGVFVRAGTPAAAIERLAAASKTAIESAAFIQAMQKIDFDPEFQGPAAFANTVAARSRIWAERIRTTGFKPQ